MSNNIKPHLTDAEQRAKKSVIFRRVVIICVVWMVAVPTYLFVAERPLFLRVVSNQHGFCTAEHLQIAAVMAIPVLIACICWAYRKAVITPTDTTG